MVDYESYNADARLLGRDETGSVYEIRNETGWARVSQTRLLPGVDVFVNDMHMTGPLLEERVPRAGMIEVDHCLEGGFEYDFPDGGSVRFGAGDLEVHDLVVNGGCSRFPAGRYLGVSFMFDPVAAVPALARMSEALGVRDLDVSATCSRLFAGKPCYVARANDDIRGLFAQVYDAPDELRLGYLRIKVVELLMFLACLDPAGNELQSHYLTGAQQALAAKARRMIDGDLTHGWTVEELARACDVSPSTLKRSFSAVHGMTAAEYLREERLLQAAKLLRETDAPVGACAAEVGYANASKFAEAFRDQMGMLPSAYRRSARRAGRDGAE